MNRNQLTKIIVFLGAITLSVAAVTGSAIADERYGKQKVVYHINYEGGDKDKKYRGCLLYTSPSPRDS